MTSQLHKKRQITARMFNRASKASRLAFALAACCAGMSSMSATAQDGMRPVPRFGGTSIRDQRSAHQKAADAAALQWRTSSEVTPSMKSSIPLGTRSAMPASEPEVSAVDYVEIESRQTATGLNATGLNATGLNATGLNAAIAPVQQVRYQNGIQLPDDVGGLKLPPGLQTSPAPSAPAVTPEVPAKPLPDFFADPFGDDAGATDAPPTARMPGPAKPIFPNELRSPSATEEPTLPEVEDVLPPMPSQQTEAEDDAAPNPFDATRSAKEREADEANLRQLEELDLPRKPNRTPEPQPRSRNEDEEMRPAEFSCDEFRKSIAESKIQDVSLDISPPYRPDVIELDKFRKLKSKFDESQEVRDWQSIDGRKLGRGRLQDLAYEKVVIETDFGTTEELPINRLSEADLAFLSKSWGLPQECLIEQVAYEPRSWHHSKVTWKASNLCHKPLYFEEVNLERYGHTAGPFVQPVVSSAHFFLNIAVLPYKMGVHSPHECQYTLGYYRPGNCAPWICPPVPISLRGGLYQAAAMTGAFWLIP